MRSHLVYTQFFSKIHVSVYIYIYNFSLFNACLFIYPNVCVHNSSLWFHMIRVTPTSTNDRNETVKMLQYLKLFVLHTSTWKKKAKGRTSDAKSTLRVNCAVPWLRVYLFIKHKIIIFPQKGKQQILFGGDNYSKTTQWTFSLITTDSPPTVSRKKWLH